eukprot:6524274-Ditylum_brightwellii.AAC.1
MGQPSKQKKRFSNQTRQAINIVWQLQDWDTIISNVFTETACKDVAGANAKYQTLSGIEGILETKESFQNKIYG